MKSTWVVVMALSSEGKVCCSTSAAFPAWWAIRSSARSAFDLFATGNQRKRENGHHTNFNYRTTASLSDITALVKSNKTISLLLWNSSGEGGSGDHKKYVLTSEELSRSARRRLRRPVIAASLNLDEPSTLSDA